MRDSETEMQSRELRLGCRWQLVRPYCNIDKGSMNGPRSWEPRIDVTGGANRHQPDTGKRVWRVARGLELCRPEKKVRSSNFGLIPHCSLTLETVSLQHRLKMLIGLCGGKHPRLIPR